MWNKLLSSPLLYLYIALGVLLGSVIGLLIPGKVALPVLQVAVAYPVMYALLSRGLRGRAVIAMLWWALMLAVVIVNIVTVTHESAARTIFHGPEYVDEMFRWIRTGIGAEGTPSQFIPQHLLHLAIFVILSFCTAGVLSLIMGAALMNYMSFYVGSLILSSRDTALAVLMGWHPWSILRVAAFVVLGTVLAEPLICRIAGRSFNTEGVRKYILLAAAGIVGDILMKWALAPWWGITLHRLVL